MSDKLTQSVARLVRAGHEYSRTYEKIREAVDHLAIYLRRVLSSGRFNLPQHYVFVSWPSGEYQLEKFDIRGNSVFKLSRQVKSRENLMAFAADVAMGWLDDVSDHLERESVQINRAARIIKEHQGMRP